MPFSVSGTFRKVSESTSPPLTDSTLRMMNDGRTSVLSTALMPLVPNCSVRRPCASVAAVAGCSWPRTRTSAQGDGPAGAEVIRARRAIHKGHVPRVGRNRVAEERVFKRRRLSRRQGQSRQEEGDKEGGSGFLMVRMTASMALRLEARQVAAWELAAGSGIVDGALPAGVVELERRAARARGGDVPNGASANSASVNPCEERVTKIQ